MKPEHHTIADAIRYETATAKDEHKKGWTDDAVIRRATAQRIAQAIAAALFDDPHDRADFFTHCGL